jgi:hypothetical protein
LGPGPGRNAPEASAGFLPVREDKNSFPPEEAGGIFPAPSTEKSAPYDSKRAGLAPGPWNPLALVIDLSSKSLILLRQFPKSPLFPKGEIVIPLFGKEGRGEIF